MDSLEQQFKKDILENVNIFQYDIFKKSNPHIYTAILETLSKINNKHINNNMLTLDKSDVKKLVLKVDKERVLIFCGIFINKGVNVALFELSETVGTYYLQDSSITRQLKNFKIGSKIGLTRIVTEDSNDSGIHLRIPNSNEIGLFEDMNDLTDGTHL